VVVRFEAEPSVQSELDHTLKLADEVIRHKILLLPDKVSEKAKTTASPASTEA
jgi:ribosomal protein S6